jgi:trypsin-like peptidase
VTILVVDQPFYKAGHASRALSAVVRVGHGRGFVVEARGRFGGRERYVITAAHCLSVRPDGQRLPPPHGFSHTEERTYVKLLAPLGKKPSVWCECLFADPIADIAVLGSPEEQDLSKQADAYEAFIEATTPLTVAEPPSKPLPEEVASLAKTEKRMTAVAEDLARGESNPASPRLVQWARRECPAFLLSLNNQWFPCTVQHYPNGMLNICDAARGIAGGMSGSPIIAEDGAAIGIVCLSSNGPHPRLMGNLPGWLLKQLADAAA